MIYQMNYEVPSSLHVGMVMGLEDKEGFYAVVDVLTVVSVTYVDFGRECFRYV